MRIHVAFAVLNVEAFCIELERRDTSLAASRYRGNASERAAAERPSSAPRKPTGRGCGKELPARATRSVDNDAYGSSAVVRRVGLARHLVHARPVVVRPRRRRRPQILS